MENRARILRISAGRLGAWRLLVAAAALAAVLALAPRALALSWSSAKSISGTDQVNGQADLAMDAAGDAVATWVGVDAAAGTEDVRASVRPAGGQFGAPVTLGSSDQGGGGLTINSQVAMDSAGDAIVIWQNNPTGNEEDVFASYRPAGGSFGSPVEVGAGVAPAVAMDSAGDAFVLSSQQDPGVIWVAQRPAGHNSSFSAPQNVGYGYCCAKANLAASPNGRAIVAFVSDFSNKLEATTTAAPGQTFGSAVTIASLGGNDTYTGAAIDDNSDAAVGFESYQSSTGEFTSEVASADGGGAFGAPAPAGPAGETSFGALAIDAQRETILTFDDDASGSGQGLAYAVRSPGAGFSSARTIAGGSGPLYGSTFPATASNIEGASGDTLYSWTFGNSGDVKVSVRPPGSSFAAPADLGEIGAPDADAIDKLGDQAVLLSTQTYPPGGDTNAVYASVTCSGSCPSSSNGGSGGSGGSGGNGGSGGHGGSGGAHHPVVQTLKAGVNHRKHSASLRFKASGASKLQCALVSDRGKHHKAPRYSACHSPKAYRNLHGRYTFYLKAVNAHGSAVRRLTFSV